ncbi:tetratricopeptide repeat protein [Treponema parvum]|uniref:Tetratricopeptide repeat protein n=1 Tax=Treponema parvum TaxID=138851 RepID=A0A975F4R5_9SPIR|nr:tetratricopeptide repeat protein [Treponema parvum]QTQ14034.1 tetratricopeptide repeat protein [Treponema parvum]
MGEVKYASLESQLGNAPCLCEDTEEMFWLRESDDYESRVKLGNLLAGQYRFREAIDAYRAAKKIRADDPMLYISLGGAYLTLRHFDEAKKAYGKSRSLGGNEKFAAYPIGVWHYLQGNYREAADYFAKVLPCGDEMKIAILYWNALCCMRENLPDKLLATYRDDMQVGHHTAYRSAVEVFLGKRPAEEALRQAEQDKNDLNAVVSMYGIAVYLEHGGKKTEAEEVIKSLFRRESAWPCISYLAAWNDMTITNI